MAKPASYSRLLLVDDDPLALNSLRSMLASDFEVTAVANPAQAIRAVRATEGEFGLALVGFGFSPQSHRPDRGFALINDLLTFDRRIKIFILSGQSACGKVQHALSIGAVDVIPKPCDPNLLRSRLEPHCTMLEGEAVRLRDDESQGELLGSSPAIEALCQQIGCFADTSFPVLVQGESGTGKELVAHLLHKRSARRRGPFLTVNCAAFTPELLEAQLFGYAKGAFTGAVAAKAGFFEEAGVGTLLLDEIGELPLALQPKLLRVLDNGEYYRLGETKVRIARARMVAATNRDLAEESRNGRFRHDLYHRLSVLTLEVPPLRARSADTLLLLRHFQKVHEGEIAPFQLEESAVERWSAYTFPGNVRELRNIVIRLGAKFPGQRIGLTELERELDTQAEADHASLCRLAEGNFKLDDILSDWEQRYINAALELSGGKCSEAARLLGVNRTTLYGKIQRISNGKGSDV